MNNDLQTKTIRIHPTKVFRCHSSACKNSGKVLPRSYVWKDKDENFHCVECNDYVEDVTDTETGKEILRWL